MKREAFPPTSGFSYVLTAEKPSWSSVGTRGTQLLSGGELGPLGQPEAAFPTSLPSPLRYRQRLKISTHTSTVHRIFFLASSHHRFPSVKMLPSLKVKFKCYLLLIPQSQGDFLLSLELAFVEAHLLSIYYVPLNCQIHNPCEGGDLGVSRSSCNAGRVLISNKYLLSEGTNPSCCSVQQL